MAGLSTNKTTSGKRRPRSAATRERLLTAARDLFLSEGYSKTSLDQVAAEAGVTKPTVYSHFESKEGLLNAVMKTGAAERLAQLSSLQEPTDDPRTDLLEFSQTLVDLVLSEDAQRWDRLAMVESQDHPEIGELFFRCGPGQVVSRLTNYLARQKRAGRLNVVSPDRAAEQLIGMLLCLDIVRRQIGQRVVGSKDRGRRCREAVEVFLRAYAAESPDREGRSR